MLKPLLTAALISLALPAAAGGKLGTPPPSINLIGPMTSVLGKAQRQIGREVAPGMRLTAATSQGNTIVFMFREIKPGAVEIGLSRKGNTLQARFLNTYGKKFCRAGSATRRFMYMGGSISTAVRDRSGKIIVGGNLTKC